MVNCCDEYGVCNQGRNCPVRVAKVGARYPKYPTYQPPSLWRVYLRHLARWILYALLGCLFWGGILLLVIDRPRHTNERGHGTHNSLQRGASDAERSKEAATHSGQQVPNNSGHNR